MSGVVVFLGGESLPWLKIESGRVVAHGDDLGGSDEPVIVIVPARSITFRNASFCELSAAQALAAARLDAAEVSLGNDRHVAVAKAGNYYVVTNNETMQNWLAALADRGLQAAALIPSPSLLPTPASGFVRAELPHETILRSANTALVEDGAISLLVVGDQAVVDLGQADFEHAVAAAAEQPPINLLQGEFAIRTNWQAPKGYWRRTAILAGLLLALTLAIPVAQWVRLSMATSGLNSASAAIAAKALGETSGSDDAVERLQDELFKQRGGGAGFLATHAALTDAIESIPGAELSSLSFDPDGTLRAMIRASGRPEIDALRRAVEERRFSVTEGAQTTAQGRAEVEFRMQAR